MDAVVELESKIAGGAKLTTKLLESTLEKFSPEATGGSISTQLMLLMQNWTHGSEIARLYAR